MTGAMVGQYFRAAVSGLPQLLRVAVLAFAWLMIATAGYFLSYQIFFIEMPLEQVASKVSGDVTRKDFRYYQVSYFRGHALEPGQSIELDVGTPWITRVGGPSVEFFLETVKPKKSDEAARPGRIQISGLEAKPYTYDLKPEHQQRFTVPWTNKLGERNTAIRIQYLGPEDGLESARAPPIILATNIVGFSVWIYVVSFALLGVALLLFVPAPEQAGFHWEWRRNGWRLVLLGVAALLFLLHSGGFTSNVLFEAHDKVGATCRNLGSLLRTGTWNQTIYRDTGIAIIPVLTSVIEFLPSLPLLAKGELDRISLSVCDVYPTSRYLLYVGWLAGLLFLMTTLRRIWGVGLAMIFAAATALYFPFLIDIFRPDADAYFIVFFAFYLGVVLRLLFDLGSFRSNAAFIVLITFLMGFTKITPIFLTLLLPLTLLLKDWARGHKEALIRCAVSVAVLLVTFQAGKFVSNQFQHPQRNIGIEGQPFQSHVFWHMIWAAYGNYDFDTAHDFVKYSKLRNERVSARTGLPETTYLRQSETATREVYKPDVLKAISERPGFFLSTALHRFHEHGLRFYRYNRLGKHLETILIQKAKTPTQKISGAKRPGVEPALALIRYGEAWKIAPMVFIGKLTQFDMNRISDTLLLAAAIVGIFCFASVPLRFFLIVIALAQISFSFLFHDVDRYFMFCSWALLLGLSQFIFVFVGTIVRNKI